MGLASVTSLLFNFLIFCHLCNARFHHPGIHQTIIATCNALPFQTLFLKNRCIVQRDGEDCSEIVQRITSKFSEFGQIDISQLEPKFVKHIQKLNYFKNFKPTNDFCVISCAHSCPKGFIMYNGMCFLLVKQKQTYDAAKQHCKQKNSHLLIIEHDLMNQFVEDMVIRKFKEPVWLGIKYYDGDKLWMNFNGTDKSLPIYYRWMFFNDGHKNAVMDYGIYNGFWKSASAKERHPFVCQQSLSGAHKY